MAQKPMDKIEQGFYLINQGIKENSGPNGGFEKRQLEFIRDMSQKLNDMAIKALGRGPAKKD